jgi:uncharacterized membrane protein YadS
MASTLPEATKQVADAVSVVTVLGTLLHILPAIAALFTIIWTGIRIWETDTIQSFFRRKQK